jgi:hypothetical protein
MTGVISEEEDLRRGFHRFANNLTLCYGVCESIPKELQATLVQRMIRLSKFTGTEAILLKHMLLLEYLRAVKARQINTFMRGNALAPVLIDAFTKNTMTEMLRPWVDGLVKKLIAVARKGRLGTSSRARSAAASPKHSPSLSPAVSAIPVNSSAGAGPRIFAPTDGTGAQESVGSGQKSNLPPLTLPVSSADPDVVATGSGDPLQDGFNMLVTIPIVSTPMSTTANGWTPLTPTPSNAPTFPSAPVGTNPTSKGPTPPTSGSDGKLTQRNLLQFPSSEGEKDSATRQAMSGSVLSNSALPPKTPSLPAESFGAVPQSQTQQFSEPEWVFALEEFFLDAIRDLAVVITEAVEKPEVAPFYAAIAELLRVSTIIDRQWVAAESRFMDSSVRGSYEKAVSSASVGGTGATAGGGGGAGAGGGLDPSVSTSTSNFGSSGYLPADPMLERNASNLSARSISRVDVVNMDLVDSMLATLVMLRVVNPLITTTAVTLLRSADSGAALFQTLKTEDSPLNEPPIPESATERHAILEVVQKRLMALAKALQKAANRRLYDGTNEEHLQPLNSIMPVLSAELHNTLRKMAQQSNDVVRRQKTNTDHLGGANNSSRTWNRAASTSQSSFSSTHQVAGAVGFQSEEETEAALADWRGFQATLRSYWVPIVNSMNYLQPLLQREHTFELDKVIDLFNPMFQANLSNRQHLESELNSVAAAIRKEREDAKSKKGGFSLGGLFSGLKKSESSASGSGSGNHEHDLEMKKDVLANQRTYADLVSHGYKRLLRKVKGEPYVIATTTGLSRHGCSVVIIYGDNIAAAYNAYQVRAAANRMACEKACPTYPHSKYNDFHIVADIAAALHSASFPADPQVVAELEENSLPPLDLSQQSSGVGHHGGETSGAGTASAGANGSASAKSLPDTRTWSRRIVVLFIPNTDANKSCPLGPNWLFEVFHSILPSSVVNLVDRIVVTQQATRLSRYAVYLKRIGKKTDDGSPSTGGSTGSGAGNSLMAMGSPGGHADPNRAAGEGEDDVGDMQVHSAVRFLFSATFGEALLQSGLDGHAVALPVALPMSELKPLLRYQEVLQWRKRAHRGMFPVLPMLMDAIILLQNYGTRAGFSESFIALSGVKSVEEFVSQPLMMLTRKTRSRPGANSPLRQGSASSASTGTGSPLGKNLAHLTLLSPNNFPQQLVDNKLLYGLRFCHSLCLLLDMYRTEDLMAHATAEVKALPCPSLPHLIDDLKATKAKVLGLTGTRSDVDISHELLQLILFISLQQHHVSGASEWRERLTQASWELYYRYYDEKGKRLMEEIAVSSHPDGTAAAAAHKKSDPALWVEVSDECDENLLDRTVVNPDDVLSFNDSVAAHTLTQERTTVLKEMRRNKLDETKYVEAVTAYFGRDCHIWEDHCVASHHHHAESRRSSRPPTPPPFAAQGETPQKRQNSGRTVEDPPLQSTQTVVFNSSLDASAVDPLPPPGVEPKTTNAAEGNAANKPVDDSCCKDKAFEFPEMSMLSVISRRRHILLYDRFIVESVIMLALRALETVLANKGPLSPISFAFDRSGTGSAPDTAASSKPTFSKPTATAQDSSKVGEEPKSPSSPLGENHSFKFSLEVLKDPDVLKIIRGVQKVLFVPNIDWWKPWSSDIKADPDWDTATFVLVWVLMRHHKEVFGIDRVAMHGPAYEALLSSWK